MSLQQEDIYTWDYYELNHPYKDEIDIFCPPIKQNASTQTNTKITKQNASSQTTPQNCKIKYIKTITQKQPMIVRSLKQTHFKNVSTQTPPSIEIHNNCTHPNCLKIINHNISTNHSPTIPTQSTSQTSTSPINSTTQTSSSTPQSISSYFYVKTSLEVFDISTQTSPIFYFPTPSINLQQITKSLLTNRYI